MKTGKGNFLQSFWLSSIGKRKIQSSIKVKETQEDPSLAGIRDREKSSSKMFSKRFLSFPIFGSFYAGYLYSGLSFFGTTTSVVASNNSVTSDSNATNSSSSTTTTTSSSSANNNSRVSPVKSSGSGSSNSSGASCSDSVSSSPQSPPPYTPICPKASLSDFMLPICHTDNAVPDTSDMNSFAVVGNRRFSVSTDGKSVAVNVNDDDVIMSDLESMCTDETLVNSAEEGAGDGSKIPKLLDVKLGVGCWGKNGNRYQNENNITKPDTEDNNKENTSSPLSKSKPQNKKITRKSSKQENKEPRRSSICEDNCGEDAYFIMNSVRHACFGVADGVGGWSLSGVDPSVFSRKLMSNAREYAESQEKTPNPLEVLQIAYDKLLVSPDENPGGSTACFMSVDKESGQMSVANLGDSGFMIIRAGNLQYRSKEQQHFFNAPYQLSLYPSWLKPASTAIINGPLDADTTHHQLRHGDVIIVGSDGLFDNVFDQEIVKEVQLFEKGLYEKFPEYEKRMKEFVNNGTQELQMKFDFSPTLQNQIIKHVDSEMSNLAKKLTSDAKRYACDRRRMSPFAMNAMHHGYRMVGGKLDDVTVLAIYVVSFDDSMQLALL